MMKKRILLGALVAGFYASYPAFPAYACTTPGRIPASDLVAAYQKGRIALVPDPDFAKGLDREALFPHIQMRIVAAPDGAVFVSNSRDHNIYKFGADGTLIRRFGKRGQGPGDLEFPGVLSLLDGARLVVGEYLSVRRISLFKLDGEFHALFKTSGPPASPTALRDGKIAYIAMTGTIEPRGDGFEHVNTNRIMILDTATGKEHQVGVIKTSLNTPKDGEVKIARSAAGDLLVGHTIRPELEVYSPDGVKKGVIKLDITPLPVTKKVAEAHQIKAAYGGKPVVLPLGDVLPFYCDFTVDEEGNILIFKMTESPKTGPIIIQVYTPGGRFLCETELDRGGFDLPIDRFLQSRLAFTSRGIYGILPERGDELEIPRLFLARYRP